MKEKFNISNDAANQRFEALKNLALDLRWSWNHSADILWNALDPDLWQLTHNPWIVLQTVAPSKLEKALQDEKLNQIIDSLINDQKEHAEAVSWFQKSHPNSLSCVAYFSMEFMLSEALPIYSGGLGNVAGDNLKAASDLGVPMIGIGLLYSEGYFRQIIDKWGQQRALYPYNDPGQLPIIPLRKENGEWLRLKLDLPGGSVWVRAWEVKVGRTKLYLLDTNDAANYPAYRGITSELYGGDAEMRIAQEIVLGIGGWRLLQALGIHPEVCHLNEGHAAFAILERARSFMQNTSLPFETALTAIRPGNLFTTHTAVPAGFDRFSDYLMKRYLGAYAESKLNISFSELMRLGHEDPDESHFNMAHFAIRGSGAINGVSVLHGKVSRSLFQSLFPRWPLEEIPIGSLTNGVHMPSWDSANADALWTKYCGKSRWLETTENLEEKIKEIPDQEIWNMRNQARNALIEFARHRLTCQLKERVEQPNRMEQAKNYLDPNALTFGFARRFASYKRPNLLLKDPERLKNILTNAKRPVQLILAGKAHPEDFEGQKLIQNWMEFIFHNEQVRSRVIFLSDYDMLLTEQLVQGVDVWINTPRRPWEACGTSGMKVLVNGGLNLSELDGWWAEAYAPDRGWSLGDQMDRGNDPAWDEKEANDLYDLLEQKVIPEFYERNEESIPVFWIQKIRNSMAKLTPRYSANRSIRQYTEKYYIPSAGAYRKRIENQGSVAQEIVDWKRQIRSGWEGVHFGAVKVEGPKWEVEVFLGSLKSEWVRVDLVANGQPPRPMEKGKKIDSGFLYSASFETNGKADLFTPRILPYRDGVSIPLEIEEIRWQK
ncbi:MAG TPA: alpha-glucan family phosphorylase [Chlamydiales bacterium]|nr:alpha-glucan family phosphorylase [Chlamydiales bacterium]